MRKSIPNFKSEEEELEFWRTHKAEDYDDGPADDIVWDLRPQPKKPVTLRLDEELITALKRLAAEHDIPYQTLARGLIERGVRDLQKAG